MSIVRNMRSPEFIAFLGCMFSGKTSAMLSQLEKYRYQNRKIFAFKPRIDDRYSNTEIVTHMGWKMNATLITSGKELIQRLAEQSGDHEDPENTVVAVDELFMIPLIAQELIWLFRNGITVVVSSLDMSSSCHPFDEVTKILPWTTRVKKCVAVCSVCQKDAHYTWRKPGIEDEEIVVGGVELYEPRCFRCHPFFLNGEGMR